MRLIYHVLLKTLMCLMVLLAILVTIIRAFLGNIEHYKTDIEYIVHYYSGLHLSIDSLQGEVSLPYVHLELQGIHLPSPNALDLNFSAQELTVELDIWRSLSQQQLIVSNFTSKNLDLDLRKLDLFTFTKETASSQSTPNEKTTSQTFQQIDNLFLRQLSRFYLEKSKIQYVSVSGHDRALNIDHLSWHNEDNHHYFNGVVVPSHKMLASLVNNNTLPSSNLPSNHLSAKDLASSGTVSSNKNTTSFLVNASFIDHGSLLDISGDVFVSVNDFNLGMWLPDNIKKDTQFTSGQMSLETWLSLSHSKATSIQTKVFNTQIELQDHHQFNIEQLNATLKLQDNNAYLLFLNELTFQFGDYPPESIQASLYWSEQLRQLNLPTLNIQPLLPLVKVLPESESVTQLLLDIRPSGKLKDVRVAFGQDLDDLHYSVSVENVGFSPVNLSYPELDEVNLLIAGNLQRGLIHAQFPEQALSVPDHLTMPLIIEHGDISLLWQREKDTLNVWTEHFELSTTELSFSGQLGLSFPSTSQPVLALYGEASVNDLGKTWKYLPHSLLDPGLIEYLKSAIQGGESDFSQVLWRGELSQYPYKNNQGIFQTQLNVQKGIYGIDTTWPPINDIDMTLFFENDGLDITATNASVMGLHSGGFTASIPEFSPESHITLGIKASGKGDDLRNFMNATPLSSSVGAALTTVQMEGLLSTNFNVYVPFQEGKEPRVWGSAIFNDSFIDLIALPVYLSSASGEIHFDNDVVTGHEITGTFIDQPLTLSFNGKTVGERYSLDLEAQSDWNLGQVISKLDEPFKHRASGQFPWLLDLNLSITDIGFNYQANLSGDLGGASLDFPFPLSLYEQQGEEVIVEAMGDQSLVSARITLPNSKYQAEIDIQDSIPVFKASNLIVGEGRFKVSPFIGHHAVVTTNTLDIDQWLELLPKDETGEQETPREVAVNSSLPQIPVPERIALNADQVRLAGLDWHQVQMNARQKNGVWFIRLDSKEAEGKANYLYPTKLNADLKRFSLYLPSLDEENEPTESSEDVSPPSILYVTETEKTVYKNMPSIEASIEQFVFQNYDVGKVDLDIRKKKHNVEFKEIKVTSGSSTIVMMGDWQQQGNRNFTSMHTEVNTDNSSELTNRFGITGGIQEAPFELISNTQWQGAPWLVHSPSLNGDMKLDMGEGVVKDASEAARIIGLFSLDSIIQRMQLDFSGVFDDGMAFNSLSGTTQINNGVIASNDIYMDAHSGDMYIDGNIDLNQQALDLNVSFTPDITSGIPVFSAFAVAPPTALYVLALTTVLSPVVEVFTEVNYAVSGDFSDPKVTEVSRRRSEVEVTDELRQLSEDEQE
ncbi:YhdP family protein [Vibrio sp.]|nr:YhdP family protein [Vibrio sp.]